MININEYFNGNVKSLGFNLKEEKMSIGVMEAGEYEFGTSTIEIMSVITGELTVKLPDSNEWQSFKAGQSFTVSAGKKFQLKVKEPASYLCIYK